MRTSIPDCSIPQISSFVNRQGLLFPGCPCSLQGSPLYNPAFLAGSPPCTRRPLLKKGSIRKLYLRTDNIFLTERYRIRNAGAVDFWVPVYGRRSMGAGIAPFLTIFAGLPPCTRRPLLKKGSIRKLFCGWQHTFHGRAKNPECRNR